jgi:hypothetical protein
MKKSGVCPKCGSTAIIGSAYLDLVSQHAGTVGVAVDGDPRAILLKESGRSSLKPLVCTQCGYVELYATDVAPLVAANEKARGWL